MRCECRGRVALGAVLDTCEREAKKRNHPGILRFCNLAPARPSGVSGGVQTMTQISISSASLPPSRSVSPIRSSAPRAGCDATARSRQPVQDGTNDRRKLAVVTRGAGGLCAGLAPARPACHRQGPLHSRPLAGSSTTKHRPTTLAKMAERDVLFGCDRMAAAVSSKTCDASAMLIVSEAALKRQSKAIKDPGKRAFLADELPDCRAARFDLQWLR